MVFLGLFLSAEPCYFLPSFFLFFLPIVYASNVLYYEGLLRGKKFNWLCPVNNRGKVRLLTGGKRLGFFLIGNPSDKKQEKVINISGEKEGGRYGERWLGLCR